MLMDIVVFVVSRVHRPTFLENELDHHNVKNLHCSSADDD
jgi:hypothetical protein